MLKILIPVAACLALTACATVPQPLTGQFSSVTPQNASQAQGSMVRWGGEVIRTEPFADHSCIYALSRPLDRMARPQHDKTSMGRFVACKPGFYDPEIFSKGRQITVVGTLDGSVTRKVGDFDYPYPRIDAETIYLWPIPEPPRYSPYHDPFLTSPFWGPGYWDPFWAPRQTIIVVPQGKPSKPDGK